MAFETFTLRFYLVGHHRGEVYFTQRADLDSFVQKIVGDCVSYAIAPGDYRNGAEAAPGVFRTYRGTWYNHYD